MDRDTKGRFILGHRNLGSGAPKGSRNSPKTEFKKGMTPWNKGTKGVVKAWNKGLVQSEEARDKNRITHLGQTPWNKGKKIMRICILCNTNFRALSSRYKYCGNICKGLANRGENNVNWRGGLRGINYLERRRFRSQIQKKVFERDNYTCQLCGDKGNLQVDHIQSWAEYVELRFNIDNCRTLCQSCHYQVTFGKPMPPTVRAWGHNLGRRVAP